VHFLTKSYSEAFPEVPQDSIVDILTWKFFSGVNPGNYWALQNKSPTEIAGGYGILEMPLSGDSKYGLVADVYTTPKYQKRGVFTTIGEAVRGPVTNLGYDFAIGFPIRPNVLPGHIKVGWKEAFTMPVYGSLPIAKALRSFIRRTHKSEYINSREFSEITEDVLKFLEKPNEHSGDQFFVSKKFTSKYVNWRLSRPNAKYTETILKDADGIKAWTISSKVYIKGIPVWAILDMQVDSISTRQTKLLLDNLGRIAVSNMCPIMAGCWNPSYAEHLNIGVKMGFFRIGKQSVIYRLHNNNLSFPAENKVRLSWMDSDTL